MIQFICSAHALLAALDCHDCERTADMAQIVFTVAEKRSCIPAAAFALIVLEPSDSFLECRIIGGDAASAADINGEACGVAIADVRRLLFVITALPRKKAGGGPAAIGKLQAPDLLEPGGAIVA